jgi:hypothetical protein
MVLNMTLCLIEGRAGSTASYMWAIDVRFFLPLAEAALDQIRMERTKSDVMWCIAP